MMMINTPYIPYTLPQEDLFDLAMKKEEMKDLLTVGDRIQEALLNYVNKVKEHIKWRNDNVDDLPDDVLDVVDNTIISMIALIEVIGQATDEAITVNKELAGKSTIQEVETQTDSGKEITEAFNDNSAGESLAEFWDEYATPEDVNKVLELEEALDEAISDLQNTPTVTVNIPDQVPHTEASSFEKTMEGVADNAGESAHAISEAYQERAKTHDEQGLVDRLKEIRDNIFSTDEDFGTGHTTKQAVEALDKAISDYESGGDGFDSALKAVDDLKAVEKGAAEVAKTVQEERKEENAAIDAANKKATEEAVSSAMGEISAGVASGAKTTTDAYEKVNEALAKGSITEEQAKDAYERIDEAADVSEEQKEANQAYIDRVNEINNSSMSDREKQAALKEAKEQKDSYDKSNAQNKAQQELKDKLKESLSKDGYTDIDTVTNSDGSTTTTFRDSNGNSYSATTETNGEHSITRTDTGNNPSSSSGNTSTSSSSSGPSSSGPSSSSSN